MRVKDLIIKLLQYDEDDFVLVGRTSERELIDVVRVKAGVVTILREKAK